MSLKHDLVRRRETLCSKTWTQTQAEKSKPAPAHLGVQPANGWKGNLPSHVVSSPDYNSRLSSSGLAAAGSRPLSAVWTPAAFMGLMSTLTVLLLQPMGQFASLSHAKASSSSLLWSFNTAESEFWASRSHSRMTGLMQRGSILKPVSFLFYLLTTTIWGQMHC